MANELRGRKIAFLATDGVEQVELTEPWKAIKAAGAQPELISLKPGKIQGVNGMDKADTFPVDRVVAEARAEDYDALVLPGGVANPDFLRTNPDAVVPHGTVVRRHEPPLATSGADGRAVCGAGAAQQR